MFPLKKILLSFFLFLLIYFGLTALTAVPAIQNGLGKTFQNGCRSLAESGFPGLTFRVREDEEVSGVLTYGIRLLYFSDDAIERAKEEARRRGDSRVTMAPPSVTTLEMYLSLIVPLTFLWSLFLVTPMSWRRRGLALLMGSLLFLAYLAFRIYIVLKAAIGASGLEEHALLPSEQDWYATLADMLGMGVNMLVAVCIWVLLGFVGRGKNSIK